MPLLSWCFLPKTTYLVQAKPLRRSMHPVLRLDLTWLKLSLVTYVDALSHRVWARFHGYAALILQAHYDTLVCRVVRWPVNILLISIAIRVLEETCAYHYHSSDPIRTRR